MKRVCLFLVLLLLSNSLSAGILLKKRSKHYDNLRTETETKRDSGERSNRVLWIGLASIGYGSIMFSSANKLESKKKEGANTGRMIGVLSYFASAWCLYSYFSNGDTISMVSSSDKITLSFAKKF